MRNKKSTKWIVRYGYLELELFPTHKSVILSHTRTGENVLMSFRGFNSIVRGFLKRSLSYKEEAKRWRS
jgi:hypothetical protein